jgi:hypothetical protein
MRCWCWIFAEFETLNAPYPITTGTTILEKWSIRPYPKLSGTFWIFLRFKHSCIIPNWL